MRYVSRLLLLASAIIRGDWDTANEDAPTMSVIWWCIAGTSCGVERDGFAAEDEGPVYLDATETLCGGWSRHLLCRRALKDPDARNGCSFGAG